VGLEIVKLNPELMQQGTRSLEVKKYKSIGPKHESGAMNINRIGNVGL